MTIKVVACWHGGSSPTTFQGTTASGHRVFWKVGNELWDRQAAKDAKDLVQMSYPRVRRRNIRFEHV